MTRYYMYRHLSLVLPGPAHSGRVLSISGSDRLCGVLGLGTCPTVKADYPQHNILSLPFREGEFDYVVSDQVIEHVEGDPRVAIEETRRVLKPGGLAIHTTVLLYPVHGAPGDFWRFTPYGLRLLCGSFSEIVDAGGWGNRYFSLVESLELQFDGIPEARWHPMHMLATFNDERYPVVTWVVARK